VRTLLQDFRYACRLAAKSPGFTLVAALTLAVGIAANTTVFSWIDTVLLRPIPGASAPSELASFETLTPNGEFITTSYLDYRDYRDHLKLLSGLAVAQPRPLSIGADEHSERVWGELVSGNYFAVLGVRPPLGRPFSREEYGDKQGAYPVAVISQSLWQRHFSGDPHVIGRTLRVNRQQITIVGVAPAEFRGSVPGLTFEIWIPAMMGAQLNVMPDWMMNDRQTRSFMGIARLRPGVTLPQARAEMAALAKQMAVANADTNEGISATLLPVWKGHFGAQSLLLQPLRILMFLGAIVLLIVCANVANLLLARGATRRKEFSLRMSLGAGRMRLIRQLLSESILLAGLGALFGVPLALWMGNTLGYLLPPGVLPVVLNMQMNGDVLAFTVLVCVLACVISGVAPALQATRVELNEALNEGGRSGTTGAHSQRMRRTLVASEVALALVAIIGAGLFARSFQLARRINPGFDAQHVAVSHLYLSTSGYSVPQRKQFCRSLADRLRSQPGILSAAYADMVPMGFDTGPWEDLRILDYTPGRSENMKIYRNLVSPGYFDLLRIPLLQGRDFTEHDDEKSAPVMVVNQTFARRFLAGRNPIGYRVHGWGKWFTIVGVVRDSKYHTPNEAPMPYFYVPFLQVYREDLAIAFYVRTAADPTQALPLVRREIRSMDPGVGLFESMPLTEFMGASLFAQKVAASFLSALGAIALVLAAVGLYSVMAFSVSQRTQEIGIRLALGARPADVLGLILRQGLLLTGLGLAAGVAASLAITRLASGLLIGVSATDPLIFIAAAMFLTAVAAMASLIPAYRATRVDPNTALRCQ
jgi:predicted permease